MHDHMMQYHVNTSWRVACAAVSCICVIRNAMKYSVNAI